MPDREPWIKVKIGIRRSGKMAALPSDTARLGWFYVLVEAKVQRQMGVFDDRRHFVEVLGRFGRYLPDYLAAGLAHEAPLARAGAREAPLVCTECRSRHPDLQLGQVIVHDYLKEQRDATNADRQAAYREAHRNEESNADVTPDVTADVTARNAESNGVSNSYSRARGTTATATATTREGERATNAQNRAQPAALPAKKRNGADPGTITLTAEQLAAWSSFGREWDDVKAAWLAKGLRFPPAGSPDDDDTSQRGLLFQVLDAWPTGIVGWIAEAPGGSARKVIDHVLARFHEKREEAGGEAEDWFAAGPTRSEAAESLAEIMKRVLPSSESAPAEQDSSSAPPAIQS